MENKGSLPPIIEDESDDNSMPHFYRKELSRSNNETCQADTTNDSAINSSHNPNGSNTKQMPYSAWKNQYCSKKSESFRENIEMQSRLGQTLESFQGVVPSQKQISSTNDTNSNLSNQYYTQRQLDNSTLDRSGQSRVETARVVSHQHLRDDSSYNFPYNETPKGYFPEQYRMRLGDHSGGLEPQLRQLHSSYRSHDQHFSPDRFNGYNSYSPNTRAIQKPDYNSPSAFDPRHLDNSGSYPGGCCSKNQSNVILPNSNCFNQPYHKDCSSQQIVRSPLEIRSCNCHKNYEVKDKKREKIERIRKKQISDLYKIVSIQNEQIIIMQNQIKKLIQLSNERLEDKSRKPHDFDQSQRISHKGSEKRMFNLSVIEENQNLMEKVSVGIMTSFIDTTKVTKKKGKKKTKKRSPPQGYTSSSGSSSSPSSSSSGSSEEGDKPPLMLGRSNRRKTPKPGEDSIALNGIEIQTVAEGTPSPPLSPVQIQLQDYDSSSKSEDSELSDSEEESPIPVGWTFYDKVVGNVNNMLDESESESDEDLPKNRVVNEIRKLGLNMEQESPSSKRVTFDSPYYQRNPLPDSDTSMKMNALAMKYYHDDKSSREETPSKALEKHQSNGYNNTNLSYATLRYLERYHLSKSAPHSEKVGKEKNSKSKKDKMKNEEKHKDKKSHKKKCKTSQLSGKILDITAIKQQPKLLPKK